ncbi:DNA-binding response regulator [Roseivirga echinicomitans]|uniref:LuxR family transcriptional regulator n=1 Tax=Roseivirga echinicomitans TaxID=296218 RepID=A0A150X9M6_9BACT|nr:DNA-binding response regulator [Roseivirga echinicomitans]KYG75447.1 hypothetical protein AWN68_07835 [Roseivirga echinicomitans]
METSKGLKIFIVEDELIIAESLKLILKSLGYLCVGTTNSILMAESVIQGGEVDLIILDINLNGKNEGIELGKLCHKKKQSFLYITSYSDRDTVIAAKETKPGGYLNKPFTPQDIMIGIEMATINHSEEDSQLLERAVSHLNLSDREMEVLKCFNSRLLTIEIANELSISTNTVKYHLKNLYSKFDVVSRADFLEKLQTMTKEA